MRLAAKHEIHILSWEKPADLADAARVREAEERLAAAGVRWHRLPYHARPPLVSKAWDLAAGERAARRIVRAHSIEAVHARSYFPSVVALRLKRALGTRFLFDMRGLWADDRVETGQMRRGGSVYKVAKRYEAAFFREADAIVSLTDSGRDDLARRGVVARVEVVPTCVDTGLFRPRADGAGAGTRLGYVGSVGPHYRFDVVARFVAAFRRRDPRATLTVVNRGQHALVAAELGRAGVPRDAWTVEAARPDEVAAALQRMDAGVFFFDATPSKAYSAPTRVAEFLASGLPFVSNTRIGDLERLVAEDAVGILLDDFGEPAIDAAADALPKLLSDGALPGRCRAVAEARFSLAGGARRYDRLYEDLGRA